MIMKKTTYLKKYAKIVYLKKLNAKDKTRINELGKIIIFIEKGKITYNDIYNLNKYISIYQEKIIIGWEYIDSQI